MRKELDDIQSILDGIVIKMQVMQDMQKQISEGLHIIDGKIANLIHNAKD